MNKVIFMGRLVADPEFSQSQSGMAYCRFRIAVDRSYTKPGEERKSDFFRITCFGKLAEHVNRYFVKGKPILIEGKIQNDNYTDNNGVQQYRDTIIADNVSFLLTDPTRTQNGNNAGNYNNYNNNNYNNQQNYNNGYNNNYSQQNRNPQPAPQQTPPPQQNNAPAGGNDDFNEFQEIISDGALPF